MLSIHQNHALLIKRLKKLLYDFNCNMTLQKAIETRFAIIGYIHRESQRNGAGWCDHRRRCCGCVCFTSVYLWLRLLRIRLFVVASALHPRPLVLKF